MQPHAPVIAASVDRVPMRSVSFTQIKLVFTLGLVNRLALPWRYPFQIGTTSHTLTQVKPRKYGVSSVVKHLCYGYRQQRKH